MNVNILKKVLLVGLLLIANFSSAQVPRTEDDVVRYFDTASNLDLVEGIYYWESLGREYIDVVLYNRETGVFDWFSMDTKSRLLTPLYGNYETHLVRTTKYMNTYYVYVIINGKRFESCTGTIDAQNQGQHWVCIVPNGDNFHVTLNLKQKIYPQ